MMCNEGKMIRFLNGNLEFFSRNRIIIQNFVLNFIKTNQALQRRI